MEVVTESVTEVARKAYVIAQLSKLEHILEASQQVYESYPIAFRETIDDIATDEKCWPSQFHSMTMGFSQIPEDLRDGFRKTIFDATYIINSGGEQSYVIPEEDRMILEGIFILVQRMKAISKRNLVKFLGSIADSEPCELKIVSTRKGTDISFRHYMDDFGDPLR